MDLLDEVELVRYNAKQLQISGAANDRKFEDIFKCLVNLSKRQETMMTNMREIMRAVKGSRRGRSTETVTMGPTILSQILDPNDLPPDCQPQYLPCRSEKHLEKCFNNVTFKERAYESVKILNDSTLLTHWFHKYPGDMT